MIFKQRMIQRWLFVNVHAIKNFTIIRLQIEKLPIWESLTPTVDKVIKSKCGIYFFGFLLKAIYFQNLGCLFFYFFITYNELFTK